MHPPSNCSRLCTGFPAEGSFEIAEKVGVIINSMLPPLAVAFPGHYRRKTVTVGTILGPLSRVPAQAALVPPSLMEGHAERRAVVTVLQRVMVAANAGWGLGLTMIFELRFYAAPFL